METRKQVSAGGVLYRRRRGALEFAVALSSGKPIWHLPKGLVDPGETLEQAAAREVQEETGLIGENEGKIDSIEYWFVLKDEQLRVHKTVHYFLFRHLGGRVEDHDWEVREVRWLSAEEAIKTLSYKSEREVARRAAGMIGVDPA
jgi:8-oxo-dGTP pyrophosphatase MutT (NUDIX family)